MFSVTNQVNPIDKSGNVRLNKPLLVDRFGISGKFKRWRTGSKCRSFAD